MAGIHHLHTLSRCAVIHIALFVLAAATSGSEVISPNVIHEAVIPSMTPGVSPVSRVDREPAGESQGDAGVDANRGGFVKVVKLGGRDARNVAQCTLACTKPLFGAWPWQTVPETTDNCNRNRKCSMCRDFCSRLHDQQNIDSLCTRDECGPGCQAACNFVMGIDAEHSMTLTYMVSIIVIIIGGVAMVGLSAYLCFILYKRSLTNQPRYEDILRWQQQNLLDTPLHAKSHIILEHLQVRQPLAQNLLQRLEESREKRLTRSSLQSLVSISDYSEECDITDKTPPVDVTCPPLPEAVFI